jgi:DNA-binding CsgD family transcriptional regulator
MTLIMKTSKIHVAYLDQSFLLTQRAMECLILASLGFPKKHIASRLGISYRTVEKHITNAKNKIGIHKSWQLLDFLFSSQIRNPVSSSIITATDTCMVKK